MFCPPRGAFLSMGNRSIIHVYPSANFPIIWSPTNASTSALNSMDLIGTPIASSRNAASRLPLPPPSPPLLQGPLHLSFSTHRVTMRARVTGVRLSIARVCRSASSARTSTLTIIVTSAAFEELVGAEEEGEEEGAQGIHGQSEGLWERCLNRKSGERQKIGRNQSPIDLAWENALGRNTSDLAKTRRY